MNISFNEHIPEDALEGYSMGKLSDDESAPLEEHLLICPFCQAGLEQTDEYIRVTKAAASSLNPVPRPRIRPLSWILAGNY